MYSKFNKNEHNKNKIKYYNKILFKESFIHIEKIIIGNNKKILDVGCASCNFEYFFLKKNYKKKFQFHCLDNNLGLIKIAKDRIKDDRFYIEKKNIKNFQPKVKFDYILFLSTICSIKNSIALIKKMKKFLNKNGQILIFDSFNSNGLNIETSTSSVANQNYKKINYFFDKNYFVNKLNLSKKFTYKYIPINFKFINKKKYSWNESIPVRIDNKIRYLRSDNYLQEQYILKIKKI